MVRAPKALSPSSYLGLLVWGCWFPQEAGECMGAMVMQPARVHGWVLLQGGGGDSFGSAAWGSCFPGSVSHPKGNLARSCCHYGADYPEESGGIPGDLTHLFNKLDGARSLKQAMW